MGSLVAREASSPAVSDLRVLIVEGHDDTQHVLGTLLRREGYRVVAAATIQEARRRILEQSFTVVVVDTVLPDGSGLELVREINATFGTPTIATSGFNSVDDIARSHEAGCLAHLIKPISLRQLVALIESLR